MVFDSLKPDPQTIRGTKLSEIISVLGGVKIDFKTDFSLTCCICVMGVRGEDVTEVS